MRYKVVVEYVSGWRVVASFANACNAIGFCKNLAEPAHVRDYFTGNMVASNSERVSCFN